MSTVATAAATTVAAALDFAPLTTAFGSVQTALEAAAAENPHFAGMLLEGLVDAVESAINAAKHVRPPFHPFSAATTGTAASSNVGATQTVAPATNAAPVA
jgi:hypothetical protein